MKKKRPQLQSIQWKRDRRKLLRSLGALGAATIASGCTTVPTERRKTYDVVVIGAGVFGF